MVKWLVVLMIVVVLYLFYLHGERIRLPSFDAKPFIDSLKQSRGLLRELLQSSASASSASSATDEADDEEEIVNEERQLHLPASWDFSDIKGALKRERIVRRVLETVCRTDFPSVRPDWLRNPRTGHKLEIDCYSADLQLAVEASGKQHYEFEAGGLHQSREDFVKQVYRDRVKKKLILARGLDFFVVPYTISVNDIPDYIINCLRELGWQ